MFLFICRCCGAVMEKGAQSNPNMCLGCASLDASEVSDSLASESGTRVFIDQRTPLSQPPDELEQLLELEEPSILQCFKAVRQAKQAIAEATAL
jgi:hypothetical protein